MSGATLIAAMAVGLLAGWIAERAMNRRHGLSTHLVTGLVGAGIGAFLAGVFDLAWYGVVGALLAAAAGAAALLSLLGLVRGP